MSDLLTQAEANRHIRRSLVQHLRDCAVEGKTAYFTDLDRVSGLDIRKHRTILSNAFADVAKEHGYMFKNVRGVGYALMKNGEALTTVGTQSRTRIAKETGRWREKFNAIPKNDFKSQADLDAWIKEQMRLKVYEEMQSSRTDDRIEAAVESVVTDPLSPANMKQILLKAQDALSRVG